MESTSIIIVGAGPSGLVLGLSLAKLRVNSIILEKNLDITDDPRGVFLSGDAVRVLWSLGVQEEFATIGHETTGMSFYQGSLTESPFLQISSDADWRHQAVPDGIVQIQPELVERVLRQKIEATEYCSVRYGCEVVSIEEVQNGMSIEYRSADGALHQLNGEWLVGADGKKGFVRKRYLEPVAGVRQETGLFDYEGTWIAANLAIKLPTPQSHPDFPLWAIGMTPENVYDLFWPDGVNFVSPPGKPTATMRFGPGRSRWWRHEFAEPDWNDSKNAEELTWKELLPMLTRDHDEHGRSFVPTTYPLDCIEIRRCGPYSFAQKVANKWFHNHTIIIGDAAHVFPPFGGQGIAAGIKDAQALAWRLAMFIRTPTLEFSTQYDILFGWSCERKQGTDDAARFTKQNGDMVIQKVEWTEKSVPLGGSAPEEGASTSQKMKESARAEREAYKSVEAGFFSRDFNGGIKSAQIYIQQDDEKIILSDFLLMQNPSLMTLVALRDSGRLELEMILREVDLPDSIISRQSIFNVNIDKRNHDQPNVYHACSEAQLSQRRVRKDYEPRVYQDRLGPDTRYVILRFDFIVYACAKNLLEIKQSLYQLKSQLGLAEAMKT